MELKKIVLSYQCQLIHYNNYKLLKNKINKLFNVTVLHMERTIFILKCKEAAYSHRKA